MLDDNYAEFLVKRKTPAIFSVLKIVVIILGALFIGVCILFSTVTYSISLFVGAGAGFGIFMLIRSWNIEYEYIVSGGELTIDKVIDQSRRKTIITIDMQKVELIAAFEDHNMDTYKNNQSMKVYDYTSQLPDAKKYAIAYMDNEKKGLYLFEPNEKVLKCLRNISPRKVILCSY